MGLLPCLTLAVSVLILPIQAMLAGPGVLVDLTTAHPAAMFPDAPRSCGSWFWRPQALPQRYTLTLIYGMVAATPGAATVSGQVYRTREALPGVVVRQEPLTTQQQKTTALGTIGASASTVVLVLEIAEAPTLQDDEGLELEVCRHPGTTPGPLALVWATLVGE